MSISAKFSLAAALLLACLCQAAADHPEKIIELPGGVPLVVVEATNGFYVGKFEITQAQWNAVSFANPSVYSGKNLPVEMVSWVDCRNFIFTLNELPAVRSSGLVFRLPTEQEWEMCCRAGGTDDTTLLENGEAGQLDDLGWYQGNNAAMVPQRVGTKEPNAWGIYDMIGNVWEWCDTSLYGGCVMKGGGWVSKAKACRATYRYSTLPHQKFDDLGFRVVADIRPEDRKGGKEQKK